MERYAKWLTDAAVLVRLLVVVLTALVGAIADAGLTGGQVGESLVRSVLSSKSSVVPAALLYPSPHLARRQIA